MTPGVVSCERAVLEVDTECKNSPQRDAERPKLREPYRTKIMVQYIYMLMTNSRRHGGQWSHVSESAQTALTHAQQDVESCGDMLCSFVLFRLS